MNQNSLGRTLRWARKRSGMTQHELAEAVRMPQPSITRIERGTVMPRADTLMALLEGTGHRLVAEPIGPPVPLDVIRDRLSMDVPKRTWSALGKRAASNRVTSPIAILRRLRRFGVPFVVIGELAEVAHGAPINLPRMVEICHADTDIARDRLHEALDDLGARSSDGVTYGSRAGDVRPVIRTAAGDAYEVLARTAVKVHIDSGLLVAVASINDLIRVRLARGTAEDQRMAELLRVVDDQAPA